MQRSSWAIARTAKTFGSKLERDLNALHPNVKAVWARWLLIGVAAVAVALLGGIALISYTSGGTNRFEWEVRALQAIESGSVGFSTAVWLQTLGTDFMLITMVLISAGLAIREGKPLLAITIVFSILFMDAVVRIGWFLFERARPNIIAEGLAAPGFHAFPSGHTSKTLVLYGLLAAQWFQASSSRIEKTLIIVTLVAISFVVPFGRVRMGAHWPTDIMGGWLIGAVWLLCALRALHASRDSLRQGSIPSAQSRT